MDLLGVGPLELFLVLLIVFLVLGPDDLAETGKKIGRFLSTVRKSEFWQGVSDVSKEIRSLPTTLMREASLEDAKKEIENDIGQVKHIPQEFKMSEFKIPEPKLPKGKEPDSGSEPKGEPEDQPASESPSLPGGEESTE